MRPCETCAGLLKESKNLVCKQFCNLFSTSDQESAWQKFGKQISVPFSHSSPTKVFLTLKLVIFIAYSLILDINRKMGKQPLREEQILGTDLSMNAPTTDNVVNETMSRGVLHKAVALLDKRSDKQSVQRVSMWQLSVLLKLV